METKGLTCKIPLDLHNRISEEIKQNESTMSKFIEQIILEHYAKGVTTMGKTRTMASRSARNSSSRSRSIWPATNRPTTANSARKSSSSA